jgi:hypothetical protein
VVAGAVVVLACAGSAREAFARKQYMDEFKAMYVKADSSDAAEKSLAGEVETAKCNVCHVGSVKKDRNAYGNALSERLDKNDKDADKIKKVLAEVAALPSDPANAGSPTFGALIKQGKLPAGK